MHYKNLRLHKICIYILLNYYQTADVYLCTRNYGNAHIAHKMQNCIKRQTNFCLSSIYLIAFIKVLIYINIRSPIINIYIKECCLKFTLYQRRNARRQCVNNFTQNSKFIKSSGCCKILPITNIETSSKRVDLYINQQANTRRSRRTVNVYQYRKSDQVQPQ